MPQVPGSLDEALNALEKDHEFLLKGDVFTQDVIRPGSTTSARTRSTPSASARTRTSSPSTSTTLSVATLHLPTPEAQIAARRSSDRGRPAFS